jgi:hypothetical protein
MGTELVTDGGQSMAGKNRNMSKLNPTSNNISIQQIVI